MKYKHIEMKPCPFCGSKVDTYKDSQDFIYPINKAKTAFNISCLIHYGGCGVEIIGGSPEECIYKWQRRQYEASELNIFEEDWECVRND